MIDFEHATVVRNDCNRDESRLLSFGFTPQPAFKQVAVVRNDCNRLPSLP
jgi:hypothetical protein